MRYVMIFLLSILFWSCNNITGNGNIQTDKRSVGKFEGVQASGSMDIEITDGDQYSVEIEADDNALPYIMAEVHNGLLDVYFKENTSFNNVHAIVHVTAPELRKLYVKGSGNITTKNTIKSESISTMITGSGDIDAEIDAREVKAEISGSGNLALRGHCKNFDGSISGSGDLKCKNLLSENAEVSIFGSGTAHVFASLRLTGKIAGSGDIFYGGNPPPPDISKAGSGSVQKED